MHSNFVSTRQRWTVVVVALLALLIQACAGATNGGATNEDAPSFTLTGTSGEQVSLSDYVGSRPVLLYFHMAVG